MFVVILRNLVLARGLSATAALLSGQWLYYTQDSRLLCFCLSLYTTVINLAHTRIVSLRYECCWFIFIGDGRGGGRGVLQIVAVKNVLEGLINVAAMFLFWCVVETV